MKRPRSTIRCREGARARVGAAWCLAVLLGFRGVAWAGGEVASRTPSPRSERSEPFAPTPPSPDARVLSRLREALGALDAGQRAEPVRVAWLGDSHTAADFWTDAVRVALAARYGDGGPGFVSLGRKDYRHAGVKLTRDGKWRGAPRKPSLWTRQDDGVFGLAGVRAVPERANSRASLTVARGLSLGPLRWDLSYRLPTRAARFRVTRDDGTTFTVDSTGAPPGTLQHVTWETTGSAGFTVDGAAGAPELFGVTIERVRPGLVLDTLGINGARLATPLAWDRATFTDELRRRSPALVVLAYGTNEVGDQVAPRRYEGDLAGLVERARAAAPEADCLVIGPTDRVDRAFQPEPRAREIDAVLRRTAEHLGCGYVSVLDVMAASGGYARWSSQVPPLAGRDGIHLTLKGYEELGAALARSLLGVLEASP